MNASSLWKMILVFACLFAVITGGLFLAANWGARGKTLGGDFILHSSQGDFSLKEARGKVAVLYFGYTSCPDVCPVSMSKLTQMLKTLPEDKRSRILLVFISVDSRGDTPEKAQQYASFFLKEAKGVTGSREEIDRVVRLYGTNYLFEETPGSAMGYAVQHSTSFFLVDPRGRFVEKIPTETTSEELKAKILALF